MPLEKPTRNQIVAKTQEKLSRLTELKNQQKGRKPTSTVVRVRWAEAEVERMRQHFEAIGLNMSDGIRMAVAKYLRDEGVR